MKKIIVDIEQLTASHREAILRAAEAHEYTVVFPQSREEALREADDAEIIFGPDVALPGAARELKWLCVPSAGVEQYLPASVYANSEAVLTNSSGAYGVTIAEHIVMVTLELMRRQLDYNRIVAERVWERSLPIRSIRDSRVTLLGTGDIGREAAIRLRAFGPKSVVGVNRSGRDAGEMFDRTLPASALDEVLPNTDLLIMSLPGTPGTDGMMDARRLGLLPDDAFLVNVGRGNALDQDALIRQMRSGRLAGAALDVFREEPVPREDPIWDCPRMLISTHTAGNMTLNYTVNRIVEMFLEGFDNYCEGRPLAHLVDRKQGY